MISFDPQMQLTAESAQGIVDALRDKPASVRIYRFEEELRRGHNSMGAKEVYRNALAQALSEV